MKPDKNTDITEQMAEMLRKHSLPYEEGAWERFKDFENARKKKVVLWPYFSGIAAAILLAVTLFMFKGEERSNEPKVAKSELSKDRTKENSNNQQLSQDLKSDKIEDKRSSSLSAFDINSKLNRTAYNNDASHQSKEERALKGQKLESYEDNHDPKGTVEIASLGTDLKNPDKMQSVTLQNDQKKSTEIQSLVAKPKDTKKAFSYTDAFGVQTYQEKDPRDDDPTRISNTSKWNFSLELSPNIKDKNVNFGGGVAVAYNLGKNVSISSGISYMQLDAQRGPNQVDIPNEFAQTSLSSYNYSKSLNAINTSLIGLDIPVNLKFNLNSSVYARAGVSVFSVLNESRYNNFEEHIAVLSYAAPAPGNADQKAAPEPMIRTVHSQEANENTPYEGKNFTGFFNLSVGYKLPLFQKLNLAIEPYLKVPIGSLSEQDMDLSNGGLKIITSF